MKIANKIFFISIIFTITAVKIYAVIPQMYSSDKRGFFDNGTYEGVMLTEQGALTLAPALQKLGSIDGKHIWKLYEANDGNMYAAISGDGAQLYRFTKDNTNFTLFASSINDAAFTSVISDNNGNIYAATGPSAKLYKYDSNGKEIWSKPLDDIYIWDMKFDGSGNLYLAAGGNNARILKVIPNGEIIEVLKTEEQHAMSLYYDDKNDELYIGTAGRGLVLKLNLQTVEYKVVYDTAESEVHTITMDNIGNLYFGTATREPSFLILPSLIDVDRTGQKEQNKAFRNSLYRADTNGTVQRLFYLNQNLVFALSSDRENNIYFITGDNTDIYRIGGNDGLLAYVGGLKNKTLSTFAATENGLYFAIARTGEVYEMGHSYPSSGTFISDSLDMKLLSKYGVFTYLANIPTDTTVTIETKTGNVARVDKTWSEFTEIGEDGKISAPEGRFLQFKVTMTTSDTNVTPIISSMSFSYVANNLAPDVLNGRLVTYYEQQNDSNDTIKNPQLSEDEAMLWWRGSDPNGDTLLYDVDYRLKGEKNYRKLASDLTTSYFKFNANRLPSAIYDFRITASDRLDNAKEDALTKTLEILNIKYDNEPPVVRDFKAENSATGKVIKFTVEDELSLLKAVRYSTLTSDWVYIKPDDGILDSMKESFTVTIEDKNVGSITIEATDMMGNTRYYSFLLF